MGPTDKQLKYLKRLGYDGPPPQTKAEASAAIDAMEDGKGSATAGKAIDAQRKQSAKRVKKQRADALKSIKGEIRFMLQENRSYGGEGLFAGFRFIKSEEEPSETERPYLGAFLPLDVASKHPELLLVETIEYEDVLSEERLKAGTPMIIGPGQFKPIGNPRGMGCASVVVLVAVVVWMIS